MVVNDVVQFNENHKWCGCIGIVDEITIVGDIQRFLVGVPVPDQGVAYIFVKSTDNVLEPIGKAVLTIQHD